MQAPEKSVEDINKLTTYDAINKKVDEMLKNENADGRPLSK